MRAMALINYYYYGDSELVAKNLRQCFALQNEDGSVNSTGPKKNTMYHLDFCLHLVATLREYYQYSGDAHLVNELMPYVLRMDQFIRLFEADDGTLDSSLLPGRCEPFLDWSSEIDKQGKSVILNAIYAYYLQDVAFLNRVADGRVSSNDNASDRLKASVNALLYDARHGLYRDTFYGEKPSEKYSLQGNMAALYGGFAEDDAAANRIFDALTDSHRFPPPFAPSYYLLIFETLAKYGKYDQILAHIQRYWGGMLSRQAVTWWEVFNPDSPEWVYPHPYLGNTPTYEMNWIPISSCHGWSGTAGYAIPRYLLGIDLLKLHENKVIINPGLGGYYKTFTYKLPLRGEILWLEFKGDGDSYKIDVKQCPQGIDVVI
jgi:alpha-L-rhamnosidase